MYLISMFLPICLCSMQADTFKFPVQITNNVNKSPTWAFDLGEKFSCEPLKDCATYSWLLNYQNVQNKLIQINLKQIMRFLENKRCIIDDHESNKQVTLESRISCPNVIDTTIEDSYDQDWDEMRNHTFEERDGFDDYEDDCFIDISHGERGHFLESLRTNRIFEDPMNLRRNSATLKYRHILHITSHGSCCWKLFSKPNFAGKMTQIEQGTSTYPVFQPKSIRSTSC